MWENLGTAHKTLLKLIGVHVQCTFFSNILHDVKTSLG